MTTPAGPVIIQLGDGKQLILSPGQAAEVRLKCEQVLGYVRLFNLLYDKEALFGDSEYRDDLVFSALVAAQICAVLSGRRGMSLPVHNQPVLLAMAGQPDARYLPVIQTPESSAMLTLTLQQGPLRVETLHENLALDVETPTTIVTSMGKNTFGVAHDPQANVTYVTAHEGTVTVQPQNRALAPVTLQTGQQVQVNSTTMGPITAVPVPTTGGLPSEMLTLVIVGCCVLLVLITLAGLAVGVLWLRRSRKRIPSTMSSPGIGVRPHVAPNLSLVRGNANPLSINLSPGCVILGRDSSCSMVLSDPQASRQHARVDSEGRTWVLTDLDSANGTLVNGVRVSQRVLQPGDQIQIGQTVLVFSERY
ncbi:MAG: FHA domain-containing protein [Chloroflexota bacterium]